MTDPRPVVDVVKRSRFLEKGSNPYLDRFEKLQAVYGWVRYEERLSLVREFAWALPDEEAIQLVASYSPIVEIGCGLGYWAALVEDRGGDVVAYDACLDPDSNIYVSDSGAWVDVRIGGPLAAAQHPDRALFLCWPPYDDTLAFDSLAAYRGDTVIYVGEGEGGCTGDDMFHILLSEEWERVADHRIPRFAGINDTLTVYRRRNS